MYKKQTVITDAMTLKERMKLILLCLISFMVLTAALFFLFNMSGATIIDIFAGADAVYYSWRDVLTLLFLPVIGYFDILVLLFLFFPFTFGLAKLWGKFSKIIFGYLFLIFFLTLPLSLYISFFPLDDYYSCGLRGPYSGMYYVKDLKMCEQFEYHPENEESDTTFLSAEKIK